jgi:hypothetical protein
MTAEPGSNGNELARRRRHEADIVEWTAQILLGLHALRQMVAQTKASGGRLLPKRSERGARADES